MRHFRGGSIRFGSKFNEAHAHEAHMACHVLHCLYLKRPIWELEDTGDVGPVQIRVCMFQQLLWHLHIASLNLEQVWVHSRQHGHHACARTSHFTRAATDQQHTFTGHSRHCILTCSGLFGSCCCCCCWDYPQKGGMWHALLPEHNLSMHCG